MPNKLTQFWQELKRRKVVRVITVYAAAAFVILELLSIIIEPLRLPEWTLQFAIVFLCIGFIIAVILSWIYDLHPEGGIVKTEPADKAKVEDKLTSSKGWKIASYISFVVIIGLIVLNIIPRAGKKEILDKSIAVLPFVSLSDDPDKQYQADGVMDAILLHLSKIEDLRVMARTSVEQYRGTKKTTTDICNELNVAYLLEGSFQKYGDHARLIIQLIQSGVEGHVWANNYDREWKDIFTVQSEVAKLVAKELQAVITPEEKQLIEKIPTSSLTAWDFYQRARAEHEGVGFNWRIRGELERAEYLYNKALEYDSTFALAYTGLAWVYWSEHALYTLFDENYLDTLLILADKALSFDHQLSEAHVVKGIYYFMNKTSDQAFNEIDKAIRFNPNDWLAYFTKGRFHESKDDHKNSIENYYHVTSLYRGPHLLQIYRGIAYLFSETGFKNIGEKYAKEALALENDSARYYSLLARCESHNGNFIKSIELYERAIAIDSTNTFYSSIGHNYLFLGHFEKALVNYKKAYEILQAQDRPEHRSAPLMLSIGQSYLNIGMEETAANYLNRARELYKELEELERFFFITEIENLYEPLGLYAVLGDKDNAFKYLRLLNQKQHVPVRIVVHLKADPAFNSIRDDPEFKQIVRDVEAKYQAEHKRVRQWLEENDRL